MLSQLRSKKTMKFTMGFVAVAFIVGYALLDIDFGGPSPLATNVVAVVNGLDVSYETYSSLVNQQAEAERRRFQRDELRTSDWERIEAEVWEAIVTEVALQQEAQRLGIRAADEEIIASLENSPPPELRQYFVDEQGQFDNLAYQQALANPDLPVGGVIIPWRGLEESLRQQLPLQKLREMVVAQATVSESEVRREFIRRKQRNTVQYVGIAFRDLDSESIEVSESDVREHYNSHPERFERGETAVLEVVQIDKKPSAEDDLELLTDANQMLEELTKGTTKDFASLAEIYSEDPSASRGGDIGWLSRGTLPAPVEAAAWELEVGQNSAPIVTEQGVYVVHVDSLKTNEDDERLLKLRQIFLKSIVSSETLDSLRTLAFEVAEKAKDGFDNTAQEYNLTIQQLDPFEQSESGFIAGLGAARRLMDWAFQAEAGDVEGPFGSDDAIFVARLVQRNPSGPRSFEAVESQVRNDLLNEHKKSLARQRLESVYAQVAGGLSFEAAAKSADLEIVEPAPFNYYEAVAGIGSANEFTAVASELLPGQTSAALETATGAYLIHLLTRDPFDAEAYNNERLTHYQSLYSRRATQIYESWLKQLRESAQVEDRRTPRV